MNNCQYIQGRSADAVLLWENWVTEPASQKPGVSKRRLSRVLNAPEHSQ